MSIAALLAARAADFRLICGRVERRLQDLHEKNGGRPITARLLDKLGEVQGLNRWLQLTVRTADQDLLSRALPLVPVIDYWLHIVCCHYLPALERESAPDRMLRDVLMSEIRRLGLAWIEDLAVRTDGSPAAVSHLPTVPIIFAPPRAAWSLLDLPGLFHELGHVVFRSYRRSIAERVARVVSAHFERRRRKVGMLDPERRTRRDADLDSALEYWVNLDRIDEFFCDIFATHVTGVAHYVSVVDMAMRHRGQPFVLDPVDEHPPLDVRVSACERALPPPDRDASIARHTREAWRAHAARFRQLSTYQLICSPDLVNTVADTLIETLETELGFIPRRASGEVDPRQAELGPESSLVDLVNHAVAVLLSDPDSYEAWEGGATDLVFLKRGTGVAWPLGYDSES